MEFLLIVVILGIGFWLLWLSGEQDKQKKYFYRYSEPDKFNASSTPLELSSTVKKSTGFRTKEGLKQNTYHYNDSDLDYDYEREFQEDYDDWKEQSDIERSVEEQHERESWEDRYYSDND